MSKGRRPNKQQWCNRCQEVTKHSKKNRCKTCRTHTIPKNSNRINTHISALETEDHVRRLDYTDYID